VAYDKFKAAKKRADLRQRIVDYKGGCCQICGYDTCYAAMEMHHVDPMAKEYALSSRMTNFESMKPELDKCVLLCCRCHRETHDGLHPGFLDLGQNDYGDDDFAYD
jgi:5-methylcytosine-specific restriction endonuclease McrA